MTGYDADKSIPEKLPIPINARIRERTNLYLGDLIGVRWAFTKDHLCHD